MLELGTTSWVVLPIYVVGLLASWLLETLLRPCPVAPWRRPLAALGVHAGVWTFAFALVLAVLQRPWLALANVLALQAVFVIVNNAKYQALREPFTYPDFIFFTDALKHPRLYLPFLGWWPPLLMAVGYGLALWIWFALEPALAASAWDALLLAVGGLTLAWLSARRLSPSRQFDAMQDLQQLGLLAMLWQYAVAERKDTQALRAVAPFVKPLHLVPPPTLPDLLVIQSESFFDPRRTYPHIIRPDVLAHYDTLRKEAVQHGPLHVDAWGANTIRTEFAFLSGLSASELGVHRFHPYRKLAKEGVATLASHLRSLGYRTICIHPYHGSFYDRDKILPKLGFDEFIDLRAFADAPRDGAYVSDLALADAVQAQLGQAHGQPLYLHVITMENHGPLHWERVSDEDARSLLTTPAPPDCADLLAYLRHLRNADAMLGRLRQCLLRRAAEQGLPGALCLFGDHVPIMPKVYRQLGEPDGNTDYLLWRTNVPSGQISVTMTPATPASVHQLAQVFLAGAGVGEAR